MSAVPFTTLMAISWLFTGLAILLTASRFWVRCKIIKRLSWDDAAHLLGLLLLVAQVSIVSYAASMIYRVSFLEAGDSSHYEAEHLLFVRLDVASILLSWCCLYAIKLAFLLLYRHIFQISESFLHAWWIVLGIVILTFWVLIAGSLTECGSTLDLEHIEKCITLTMMHRQKMLVIYSCALNVFSDLAIMALPLAMLKGLQMRTSAKVGLVGVFCCAFITIVFDILRAVETDTRGGIKGSTALWTNLESAVAVIVSCLPSLTAFFNTKNARNGAKSRNPYKQRSLAISDSAKLYMSAGSSLKSEFNGRTSAAEELEKSIVSSSCSMPIPVTDCSQCIGGSIV